MNGEQVDLLLVENSDQYYEIAFTSNGDFLTTEGIDTSLLVSFFTDKRANSNEVSNPYYQRGWWGTLYKDSNEPELGSKIWLLDQSVNTQETLNKGIAYITDAYNWLVQDNYADKIEVSGTSNFQDIYLTVKIIKDNNVINEQVYNLWKNTIENINNGRS